MGGSIDPIEYDVAELRLLARVRGDRYVADGFLWTELPESLPPTEETAEYDRPTSWSGSLDERQKPYLRRLPGNDRGQRLAMEWLRGLVDRAGSGAAVEALAYYESLGWLTESVREELEDHLLAVGYRGGGSLADLTRADHIESLARTARLAQLSDPEGETAPQGDEEPDASERSGSDRSEGVTNEGDRSGDGSREAGRGDSVPAEDWEWNGTPTDGPDWNGTVASLGDGWLNAVVSDVGPRPPPGPGEGAEGGGNAREEVDFGEGGDGNDEDGEEDSGFEFGPR